MSSMADVMAEESTQTQSIHARIAALNLGHVGRAPIAATAITNDEEPPDRPQFGYRSNSTVSFPTSNNGTGNEPTGPRRNGILPPPSITRTGQAVSKPARPTPPPRLPPRTSSSQASPSLPPRRQSGTLGRRDSNESIASTVSNLSTISNISNETARTSASRTPSMNAERMIPPAFNPSTLPPLPPKRPKNSIDKKRLPLQGTKSSPTVVTVESFAPREVPSLPPRTSAQKESSGEGIRNLPPMRIPPVRSKPTQPSTTSKIQDQDSTGGKNGTPDPTSEINGVSPPIPLASRPDLSKILASKPKVQLIAQPAQIPTSTPSCLLCRDFSGPDIHAVKFPRESVPSLDWLATQLVAPFHSLTDKARAIFTWLHHNISYDVVSFFNGKCQPSTPASTLSTGLAVCEGYAGLFSALAGKAGLESLVINGHGKGYGFATLAPGDPIPAEYSTHAWNAVKIDNGEWKLIDCCWGAGHVSGKGKPYEKSFKPQYFTMSNNAFGLRHFPTNKSLFFRTDNHTVSWEEYIIGDQGGELVRVYTGVAEKEGLAETKFLPKHLKLPVAASAHQGPTVRFQFERTCAHWDPVRNGDGKSYVFILKIHGVDGRQGGDYVPFETNGTFWWADVPPSQLGAPGQTITLYTVETVSGAPARGLSVEEYKLAKGRKAMGFGGVAAWELV